MKMKLAPGKAENKKRKRDDSKEAITECPKKAKVHAQRKFAQGAALNNSVITPIKDKSRPTSATASSGPMLTTKCPNTEDFLTFLCFRRTSILPPKLDFFKEAVNSENETSLISNSKCHGDKSNFETNSAKKNTLKKNSTNNDVKKPQPASVQALRKKYQEQRLAKQKVSNVTKLAQKVKGKNMVRTRSSVIIEETKPTPKKRVSEKENKIISTGLRSGLKRVQPAVAKPIKKVIKFKHLRTGLRSSLMSAKTNDKVPSLSVNKPVISGKKADKESKKHSVETSQSKGKNVKPKKPDKFSDFSSDDNEPLLAVKKTKLNTKKTLKMGSDSSEKEDKKKKGIRIKSPASEAEAAKMARPTRKTKEAAALYVEMITRKLVSPDKSGDDDVSSVESFPELPNAKKNEQRESEIKARALAVKKAAPKAPGEERERESKKTTGKKGEASKSSATSIAKDEPKSNKRAAPFVKAKEFHKKGKKESSPVPAKRANRSSTKVEDEKEELTPSVHRPSTRSRPQEKAETVANKSKSKTSLTEKLKPAASDKNSNVEKAVESKKKIKGKSPSSKSTVKEEKEAETTIKTSKVTIPDKGGKQPKKGKEISNVKETKSALEKYEKIKEEVQSKKSKKGEGMKKNETEATVRNVEKHEKIDSNAETTPVSKRPTRKCSAADKLCFIVDSFTSGEDDFESPPDKATKKAQSLAETIGKVEVTPLKKETKKEKQSEKEIGENKEETRKVSEKVGKNSKSSRDGQPIDSLGKKKKKKNDTDKKTKEEAETEKEEDDGVAKRRTRPVRQCSTGEKRWIETDSDSFSFYDTSDDEDAEKFLLLDFGSAEESARKSDPDREVSKKPEPSVANKKEDKASELSINKLDEKNIGNEKGSESGAKISEEKSNKEGECDSKPVPPPPKAFKTKDSKCPSKIQRDLPGLQPLKKSPSETKVAIVSTAVSKSPPPPPSLNLSMPLHHLPISRPPAHVPPLPLQGMPMSNQPKPLFDNSKNLSKGNVPIICSTLGKEDQVPVYRGHSFVNQEPCPVVSVPNRIEMILHSLKKDKLPEKPSTSANDVKVTFGTVPYHPVPHSSQVHPSSCNYPMKPLVNFPPPREPISTHGLDLLSEVALPTTPKEKINSQTERIEKWLKDSLAAENKKTYTSYEDGVEYKEKNREERARKTGLEKPAIGLYYGKPAPPINLSSHVEGQKFGQAELTASQKLLKKNLFAAEAGKIEHQAQVPVAKKTLTSVQDLLKLQKERKEASKSPADNSPHLKNCKCNSCVVKKGWFKNKPVPKLGLQKLSPSIDESDGASKPFESLTKAFKADQTPGRTAAEGNNSKISVSVAPIVVTSPALTSLPRSPVSRPSTLSASPVASDTSDRKAAQHQRKMSFLERMKERERKETAAKATTKAFSPNNESSVYAFEPEQETKAKATESISAKPKTRDSRTSSTSKSEDDCLRICEDEICTTVSSGTQIEKPLCDSNKPTAKVSQSASIAVQVNLDTETITEVEATPEVPDGKSNEISTQTEVPEEDSDSPMFYIPLQQTASTSADSPEQPLIQGVALKLGTEGPKGPNQRVVMKAKLVTKPTEVPSMQAVVLPQPKRIFDQKSNNPPIGTVQPTTRKPPEESKTSETGTEICSPSKESSQARSTVESQTSASKSSKSVAATLSAKQIHAKAKDKAKDQQKDKGELNDECVPPSSSAASSSSSSKSKKTSKQKAPEPVMNSISWPSVSGSLPKIVEAPTFYASEKDFQDPFEFFERIRPTAEKFGLCRIVPPSNFKPDCKVSDDMRFTAYNQYVHRMFHRWGPNMKEMMAIKKYLATQSISLKQPPWIGGIEVDLPRLYQSVQNCGGLMKVMEKKKWNQVADMMRIPKAAQDRVTKLDDIYCKYLLPYDTLSPDERQKLFEEVEKDWAERLRTSPEAADAQAEEDAEEDNYMDECEECVVKGRNMALNQFYRIARNTMTMWFKSAEPSVREVENEFWRHVSERSAHVCVHSGSIDSSGWGYGFPVAKNNSFSRHPWNLKVLTNNSRSVLRSLGPAMGITVPTLHVGMVFTAFCWYRDPHGLPWIEYLHAGAPKIWYGISNDNSTVFQDVLAKLLPRYIKNKKIWLPSDTAMIPPALLVEHGVSLCRTVQEPGQFILVFPRAFISSICTGYMVSESVYFAQSSWLTTAEEAFKDIQESCEPSMFSLEKLLFSIATDSRCSVEVLKQVVPMVWHVRQKELDGRKTLFNLGLKTSERMPSKEASNKKKQKKGRRAADDEGDYECEVCRTNLFVSLVTNSHEEGTYCLPHAIDLLTRNRQQLKYCKLMYSYSQEEMNELVEKLEKRIESKSQKKLQSGKSGSSTSTSSAK